MKRLPLHTLVLLSVFLHSGSCAGGDGRCVPLFVRVGEKATIECSITNPDQDGVYMYRLPDENREEDVSYYYSDGTLTPEKPYRGRLETNKNFRNFSVTISNVNESDGGVYWCKFNKHDVYTLSERTCLLVQSGTIDIYTGETKWIVFMYLGVISGLSFIILVLVAVLVTLCRDRRDYTPKQQPSNGVYEVMRGHTAKTLINPAYESSQRPRRSDSS